MLVSSTRTVTGALLGVAALGIGAYLLVVGDPSAWPLIGAGALCLTTVLVLRTTGRRLERSGAQRRQASPRAQRIARVAAGVVLLVIAVVVLTSGDMSDPTARGLPRWLFGGLNLVLGLTFLGWDVLRPGDGRPAARSPGSRA